MAARSGDCLVFGAGAGRLAYDLHLQHDATRTVAIDFNPLLLLIARKIYAGETLALHEFPIAPRTANDVAVLRELSAPTAADETCTSYSPTCCGLRSRRAVPIRSLRRG